MNPSSAKIILYILLATRIITTIYNDIYKAHLISFILVIVIVSQRFVYVYLSNSTGQGKKIVSDVCKKGKRKQNNEAV